MKAPILLALLLAAAALGWVLSAPARKDRREARQITRRSDVTKANRRADRAWRTVDTYVDGIEQVRATLRTFEDAYPEAAQMVRHDLRELERRVAALPPARRDLDA